MASNFWSSCPSCLNACIPGATTTLDSKKPVTQAGDLGFMLTFPSLPFTDSEPWRETLFVTLLWWSRINSPAFQRGQEDWLCRTDLEDVGPHWASGPPCCRYANLLFKACPARQVALSLACYLLVSKVQLTFACLARTCSSCDLGWLARVPCSRRPQQAQTGTCLILRGHRRSSVWALQLALCFPCQAHIWLSGLEPPQDLPWEVGATREDFVDLGSGSNELFWKP